MQGAVAGWIASLGVAFVWGGDFNMLPDEIAQSGWVSNCKGVVVSPGDPTLRFHERTVDFFVVHETLVGTIRGMHGARRAHIATLTRCFKNGRDGQATGVEVSKTKGSPGR